MTIISKKSLHRLACLAFFLAGFALTFVLNGCGVGGMNPYIHQTASPLYDPSRQGFMGAGGPVGRVAAAQFGRAPLAMVPPEAGMNVYAGSRYDSAQHGNIVMYDAAQRGPMVPMGGDGPAVAVGQPASTQRGRAASAEQVQHLSVAVGQMARTQREQGETLRSQGVAIGQLAREQHRRRHRRAEPPPVAPTAEATAPPTQPSADASPTLAGTVVYPDQP